MTETIELTALKQVTLIPGKHKPDGVATVAEQLHGKIAKRTLLPGRVADAGGHPFGGPYGLRNRTVEELLVEGGERPSQVADPADLVQHAAQLGLEENDDRDDDGGGHCKEDDGVPEDRYPGRPNVVGPQQMLHNSLV